MDFYTVAKGLLHAGEAAFANSAFWVFMGALYVSRRYSAGLAQLSERAIKLLDRRISVTKGDYTNLRELDQPRAGDYDARYKPYLAISNPGGFNVKQFRSNAVVRWEYRPGSAVYLVWQQGRENSEPELGGRSFRGDFHELFQAHPDNTFLIKMSYWFDS